MTTKKLKIKWCLSVLAALIIISLMSAEMHEGAHSEICRKYNGTVIYSGWSNEDMTFITICHAPENDYHKLAQSEVESFGYQLQAVSFAIIIMVFVLGYLLIWLRDDKKIEGKVLKDGC